MVKRLPALFLVLVVALLSACATGSNLPGITASGNKASVTGGPAVSAPAYKGGTASGPALTTPNKGRGGRLPSLTSPSTRARKGDPFNAGPHKVDVKKKKKEKGLFPKSMRR